MTLGAPSTLQLTLHGFRAGPFLSVVLLAVMTLKSGPAAAQAETPQPAEAPQAADIPAKVFVPEAADALTAKEKELLEQIRRLKAPRWRSFGACKYDWTSWRLSAKGVRTTMFRCGDPPITGNVAVFCSSLRISRQVAEAQWESWRLPLSLGESAATGGEDLMVANLCANAKPAPNASKEAPAQPGAVSKPAAPPAAKPVVQPAVKSAPKPKPST
ncbi:hypothetical protein [Synechococcus sp. RedBA-s]|uniref:hypothetical protein n=1 Tax=Synechococcus sp. RedBA-s TaxID=2823741 RepID=UPI0020CB7041|nr:hypothetical protein [Synechococcus sp. RedBA-s]MCP9799350.1 hypothetical protein [Synechococcus sp. RedBA-s]